MGLQSALSTALTGLTAAETSIDVAGNNVANANTVGFKESQVSFATQFLQTQSIGSAPTDNRGGTNPRQVGLGVKVAEIAPKFTQGTIQISSNPLDLAVQGDGFFIVEGAQGDRQYTRNGQLKLNGNNEIVTTTGQRVLGFGVDDNFSLQQTTLVPLTIPLGSASVAQATQNVFFEGGLFPDKSEIGKTPEIINSVTLSDGRNEVPSLDSSFGATPQGRPVDTIAGAQATTTSASVGTGTYNYKFTFVDGQGNESPASIPSDDIVVTSGNSISLTGIPQPDGSSPYTNINVYRADSTSSVADSRDYRLAGTIAAGTTIYTDTAADATIAGSTELDDTGLTDGAYSYYVTFYNSTSQEETRPTAQFGPFTADANNAPRILMEGLPRPDNDPSTGGFNGIHIYRNLPASDPNHFYRIGEVTPTQIAALGSTDPINFIDNTPDSAVDTTKIINLDGPAIDNSTPLTDLYTRQGPNYVRLFDVPAGQTAVLSFTATKGDRELAARTFTITEGVTDVGTLIQFMNQSMGIVLDDSAETFPSSIAGGAVDSTESKLRFTSNMGIENALSVGLSAFKLTTEDGNTASVGLNFASTQKADGEGATADVIVYDSLGSPLRVRVTTVLEATSGSEATFRWIATSADNDIENSAQTLIGTGVIKTDGSGKLISQSNNEVSLGRESSPAASPLAFTLDFSQVTGLDEGKNTLSASGQDGFPAGSLTSFIITETGGIQGVFSNGSTRVLGQIRMARFANNNGLEQKGENLFSGGVNSGLPIEGNPGENGIGGITAGAVELSNTDIGQNLIELILASTQYRGGARVISSVQNLLDELLALGR